MQYYHTIEIKRDGMRWEVAGTCNYRDTAISMAMELAAKMFEPTNWLVDEYDIAIRYNAVRVIDFMTSRVVIIYEKDDLMAGDEVDWLKEGF